MSLAKQQMALKQLQEQNFEIVKKNYPLIWAIINFVVNRGVMEKS